MPTVSTPDRYPTFPVNLNIADRPVLVVGGGRVAARKVSGLLAAGGNITVVADDISVEMRRLQIGGPTPEGRLTLLGRPYRQGEAADYWLAITATDNPAVNHQVFVDCETSRTWCNSADDIENCSFILPAITRRNPMTVSVSSNGTSPALSSWINRRIGELLPTALPDVAMVLADARVAVRASHGTTEAVEWTAAIDATFGQILHLVEQERHPEALKLLLDELTPVLTAQGAES